MKTRVVLSPNGSYKIQKRYMMLFWSDLGGYDFRYGGQPHHIIKYYDTKEMAVSKMIKMHVDETNRLARKKASGVVLEISTDDVKEKFAEHFV